MSAPEVHVRIRRLSIDAACSNADALDAHALGEALQAALSARPGGGADDRTEAAAAQPTSFRHTIASAIASHVQPLLGGGLATVSPLRTP